jgi:4-amino-4-deoxy-L-arabinose transferase-like glycosyltransferase
MSSDRPGNGGGRGWSRRAADWKAGAALVLLCLAVYLPGFFALPPVDRDESRFAQASRQMFEAAAWPLTRLDLARDADGTPRGAHSGGWAIPMVQDRPRLNKPPLIYWLQASCAWVCTRGEPGLDAIWMYRIPSLTAAILAVLITWRWGCSMFHGVAAWTGAALLALCPVMFWEARQARADMVLVAVTAAACWMLWECWRAGQRGPTLGTAAALWIALALGVLVKGPMTPLVIALAVLTLGAVTHRWRWTLRLRPGLGLLLLAAMVAPWVWMVGERVGWHTYLAIVHREVLGRSLEGQEGHAGPPGYHLLVAAVMFWPGVLYAGVGLWRGAALGLRGDVGTGHGWSRARRWLRTLSPARRPELFLLCLIVPTWIVMEVVSTKLPHYTMPVYPALALLAGRAVWSARTARVMRARWVAWAAGAWSLLPLGLCVLGAGLVVLTTGKGATGSLGAEMSRGAAVGAGVGALLGLAGYWAFKSLRLIRRGDYPALLRTGALVGALALMGVGWALPRVRILWVTTSLARAARQIDPARPVAVVSPHEDSTIFIARGNHTWVDEHRLKHWLARHPDGIVILPEARAHAWPAFSPSVRVSGFNYSKGKWGDWVVGEFPLPPSPPEWVQRLNLPALGRDRK